MVVVFLIFLENEECLKCFFYLPLNTVFNYYDHFMFFLLFCVKLKSQNKLPNLKINNLISMFEKCVHPVSVLTYFKNNKQVKP